MAFINPQVPDFKAYFYRDFPYGTDINKNVLDADIAKALVQTNTFVNQGFYGDQQAYNIGYLNLAAHYLVMDMRAGSQGINGQFNFLQSGKAAAATSESFSIPQRVLDNPQFSWLYKTHYGAFFLSQIFDQLCGQVFTVREMTKP